MLRNKGTHNRISNRVFSAISVAISFLLFFFYKLWLPGNLALIFCNTFKEQITFNFSSNSGLHAIFVPKKPIHSTNKEILSTNALPRSKYRDCKDMKNKQDVMSHNEIILLSYSDTIDKIDLVRKQYELLPYPIVTQKQIQMMKRYYEDDQRNIPLSDFFPSSTLEYMNHFLYRGQNHFT